MLTLIEAEPGHRRAVQYAVGRSIEQAVTPQVPLRGAQDLPHLVGLRLRGHQGNGRVASVTLVVQEATAHHREAGRNSVELQEALVGIGRSVGQPNEFGVIGMAAELPETRIIGQHSRDPVVRQIDDHLGPHIFGLTGRAYDAVERGRTGQEEKDSDNHDGLASQAPCQSGEAVRSPCLDSQRPQTLRGSAGRLQILAPGLAVQAKTSRVWPAARLLLFCGA